MPKPYDNLFLQIANFQALIKAAQKAVLGKRNKPGAAKFMANLEKECLALEHELQTGSYQPGRYKIIHIKSPKERMVSAAPFRDRVVHHALCQVIDPLIEPSFIYDSYANRKNKGTHKAIMRYEKYRDRYQYVLRCDLYRYFPSIDHEILKRDFRKFIACSQSLGLMDLIVDHSNPQERVNLYFAGDDLFSPYVRRRGLPIGNLTSQFFANLYLNGMDHFIKEVLKAKGYVRYVDDFALFSDSISQLEAWENKIADYLMGRRLKLHPRKVWIAKTNQPTQFLGYELYQGYRRLPEDNIRRFRGRFRSMQDKVKAGSLSLQELHCAVKAWEGHAGFANTWRLRHSIFKNSLLQSVIEACPSPCDKHVLRGGSWNNNPNNLRSANRNRNNTDNRNNNNGFRLSRTASYQGH